MPYDQPEEMPKDMEDLDFLIAKAYNQGIETGRKAGRSDCVEAMKKFWLQQFNLSKGRRRRADPDDPKTAAIADIWQRFNEKLEDESLWQ
jgi:hypothetical protein